MIERWIAYTYCQNWYGHLSINLFSYEQEEEFRDSVSIAQEMEDHYGKTYGYLVWSKLTFEMINRQITRQFRTGAPDFHVSAEPVVSSSLKDQVHF